MNRAEALAVLITTASAWAENAEESAPRRILAEDTDEALAALVAADPEEIERLREVRDVWLAIDMLGGEMLDGVEERSVLVHNVDDGTSRRVPLPPRPAFGRPMPFGAPRPTVDAVCWKDEGRTGPVWLRDSLGGMTATSGWLTRTMAKSVAAYLGVELIES